MQIQTLEDLGGRPPRRLPRVLFAAGLVVAAVALASSLLRGGAGRGGESADAAAANAAQSGPAAVEATAETASAAEAGDGAATASPLSEADVREAVARSKTLEAKGKVWDARETLLGVLDAATEPVRAEIERSLARLADAIYLTARPAPGKTEYAIKEGDSLSAIASRHVCPVAFIMKANGISDASRIRPGQRLVFADHPKFEVFVSKEANTLLLTLDGKFYKRYSVGTGRDSGTPVGTFKIRDRIEHPEWWSESGKTIPYGDPANILGTHWLALEATGDTPRVSGYGIHGTWDESSLGKQSSAGCVRMRNSDVEELFTLLPRGTPVTITEAP